LGSTQLRKQAFWKGNEAVAQTDFCFCSNTQIHIEHREEIKFKDLGCLDQTYTANARQTALSYKTLTQTHTRSVSAET